VRPAIPEVRPNRSKLIRGIFGIILPKPAGSLQVLNGRPPFLDPVMEDAPIQIKPIVTGIALDSIGDELNPAMPIVRSVEPV